MEGRTYAEESTGAEISSSYGRFARRPEELSLDDGAAANRRNPSAANEEARSSGEDNSSGSSSEDEDSIYGEHSDRLWRNPHELSQHAISNAGGSSDLGVARRKLSSVGSSEAAERVIVEDYVLGARAEDNLAHFSSREREFGSAASLSAEDVDAMAMPRRRKSGIDRSRGIDEISNLSAHINKKRSASPAAASVATVYSHHEAGAPEQAQGKTSQTSVRGHRMKVKSELADGATENPHERRAASKTGDHHQHNNASASLSSSKTTTYMSSGLSSSSGVLTGGGPSSSSSSSSAASASREHEHEFRAPADEAGGAAGAAAGATTVTTSTEGATNLHSTTRAGVVPPLELPLHKAGAWMQSSAQLRAFHVGGAAPEGTSHLAHLNTSFYHHAARNSNHKKNRSASFDSSVCTTGLNPRVGRRPPRGAAGRQPEDRWDEQQHHHQHAVFTTTGPSSGQRRRVDMTGVSQQHAFSFKNTEGTNSGTAGQAEGGQAARGSHPRQESRFRMPRASSKDPIEGRGVNIGGAVNYQPRRRIRSSERWLRRVLSQDSRSLLPLHPQALQNLSPATKKRHRENGQEFFREKSTAADDSLSSSDNSSDSDSDSEESPTSSSDYHSDAVVGKSPQKKKAGGIKSERIKKRHQQFQAPPRFLCCPNQDCLITLKQALQQFTTSR